MVVDRKYVLDQTGELRQLNDLQADKMHSCETAPDIDDNLRYWDI